LGALGALLAFLTSFVTLSFLVTTPEAWVPALGDGEHGFPWLAGGGRLVLKDVMLWAGGLLLLVDSARQLRVKYAERLNRGSPVLAGGVQTVAEVTRLDPELARTALETGTCQQLHEERTG